MIEFQTEKHEDREIFAELNALLSAWFKWKFEKFSEPQKYAILNIHRHENTLVSAPTGSGKTLSAFAGILSELLNLDEAGQLEEKVYCIYVSPLKALNNDIEKNLREPLNDLEKAAKKLNKKIGIRVAVRTGDTTASEKQSMLRKPPHILITTPESLAIVLNAPKFREKLREIQFVIVDEIHSLASNKRGTHFSLTLERLERLSPGFTRIGLSATVSPLEEVAKYLAGLNGKDFRNCKIVDVSALKSLDLQVISPINNFINTTSKEIFSSMYAKLHELIQKHTTTLIFTNTRSATERVVHNLKDIYPKFYGANIGAHHSSLSKEHRLNIENRLKEGELKVVVSSTSLELGIDIGFIDLVVLLSSPKGVARALQRVGRSGHKLHDIVKGRLVVIDRDDLIECSVLLKDAIEKKIDKLQIPENALDVLAQHIYGAAIAEVIHIDELWKMIRNSYCYRNLERIDFNEVISYLAGEFYELENRHVYAKIWLDEETGNIGKKGKLARVIYMNNIGTIPEESMIKVKIQDQVIGVIDEMFAEYLKKGDVFVLGGNTYEFKHSRGMTIQVNAAYQRPPTVPSWFSQMLPLSFDLAIEIGKFRELMEEKFNLNKSKKEIAEFIHAYLYVDKNAANAIYEYFKEQYLYSVIPHNRKIVVETYRERDTFNHIFHSLYGRRVNDALSRAFGFVLGKIIHKDIEIVLNDNGFILKSSERLPIERAAKAINSRDLKYILERAIDDSEILKRRFRHCASRALMILRSYKGRTKTVGKQQMSARLLLSAVRRISENFPILKETKREILEDVMDIQNTEEIIKLIEKGKIQLIEINVNSPSPFAFNLFLQGYADILKVEERIEFIKRMHEKVMQKIEGKNFKEKPLLEEVLKF